MCHERGLGVADPREIEVVGEDVANVNFGFETKKSFVIWGDQMLRKGPLQFLEKVALHSPLVVWAPMASNVYHDFMWYPTVGQSRILHDALKAAGVDSTLVVVPGGGHGQGIGTPETLRQVEAFFDKHLKPARK